MTRKYLIAALVAASAATGFSAPAAAQMFGGGDPMDAFANADANGDGIVTKAEFLASRNARFDKMDRNGDGVVSRDDFGMILKFRPQAGQKLDAFIKQADANHDGKVNRAELAAAPTPIFDLADANHDGKVDKAEMEAARTRLQAMKQ